MAVIEIHMFIFEFRSPTNLGMHIINKLFHG